MATSSDTTTSTDPLPRNVRILALVSMLQDASSKMVFPLLPLFLVGSLGAPPVVIGVVEGVADATSATAKLLAGGAADRRRRSPMVQVGYGLAAIGKVLLAVATVWPIVLLSRFIDRVGKGVRSAPRDAIIAESIDASQRGRAYGYHRTVEKVGATIGPLIGIVAYRVLGENLRVVLWIAIGPALLAWLLTFAVTERVRPTGVRAEARRLRFDGLGPGFWRSATPLWMFALVNCSDAFLLLRASELGFGVEAVLLAFVGYNLVCSLASQPIGVLSDRVPRRRVLAGGVVVFAATFVGMAIATAAWQVWVLLAVYGLFGAMTDGVAKAAIVDTLDPARRAGGLGLFHAGNGYGALAAGIWVGLAWGDDGSTPLLISGLCAVPLAVLIAVRT